MWRPVGLLALALLSLGAILVAGQEEPVCLDLPTPDDFTDTEAVTAFIDNCGECGKFVASASVIAACSQLKNSCPVPSGDLPPPKDAMMSENMTKADNATMADGKEEMMMASGAGTLNATVAKAALEAACNEAVMETCIPESIALARSGDIDVDCAKILVLGPSQEVEILGCNSAEAAEEIFNEIATTICMAANDG